MKRSMILLVALMGVLATASAFAADPTASRAVSGEDSGISTIAITVKSGGEEVYGVAIKGANIEDIRAPRGWVGVASGSSVIFRTGESPVSGNSAVAFKILTREPGASLTVSFRGKDDPIGKPLSL